MLSNTDRPSDGTVDAEPEPELESTTFSPSTSSLKGFFSISLLSLFILTSTFLFISVRSLFVTSIAFADDDILTDVRDGVTYVRTFFDEKSSEQTTV